MPPSWQTKRAEIGGRALPLRPRALGSQALRHQTFGAGSDVFVGAAHDMPLGGGQDAEKVGVFPEGADISGVENDGAGGANSARETQDAAREKKSTSILDPGALASRFLGASCGHLNNHLADQRIVHA